MMRSKRLLTPLYIVKVYFGQIFSIPLRPGHDFHSGGGLNSGGNAASSNSNDEKLCKRRTSMNDTSLYANCCPRQIRGPALKGRKMNGLGRRYFLRRSSRNRSGSNSSAVRSRGKRGQRWQCVFGTDRQVPRDPFADA